MKNKDEDLQSIPPDLLYQIRLLLFIEAEPQSNQYKQIYLTPKQFKKVSDALAEAITGQFGPNENIKLKTSDEVFELPDLKEYN